MPGLDIIIVNWNAGQQLADCLASVAAARRDNFEMCRVVVVDNASTDGSADDLARLNLPLTLIRNAKNRGFAAACNQGAANSTADYLLFLNPDMRLQADSLCCPIHFLQQPINAPIGICGIQMVDANGQVSRSCARFPTPRSLLAATLGLDRILPHLFAGVHMREWDHARSCEVNHVIGAFFLLRRSLFETLHGFDERFFLYLEDVDLSLRARKAGYRTMYCSEAQAYHKANGTSEQVKANRLFYHERSRILYGFKHFGRASALCLLLAIVFVEPVMRMALACARLSLREMLETLQGCSRLGLWAGRYCLGRARQ